MNTMTGVLKFRSTMACTAMLFVAGLASSANADVWIEQGDAPSLQGQVTLGNGSLDRIDGTLFNPDFDPDLFCITIDDPANFSATTVGSSIENLSLWLFDDNYFGVAHDGADDGPFGPNAGYQASLSSTFVTGGPGVYFLGVTRGGIDALGFQNPDLEIWLDNPTVESAPNGPGSFGSLQDWTFPGYGVAGAYSVHLTGATFHGPANIPEPATGAIAFVLLTASCLIRRRG